MWPKYWSFSFSFSTSSSNEYSVLVPLRLIDLISLQSKGLSRVFSTLAGHKQNLACTKTPGKGAVTPPETEDLPGGVGGSPMETLVNSGSLQAQGHWPRQAWKGEVTTNSTHRPYRPHRPIDPRVGSPKLNNKQGGSTTPPISR